MNVFVQFNQSETNPRLLATEHYQQRHQVEKGGISLQVIYIKIADD